MARVTERFSTYLLQAQLDPGGPFFTSWLALLWPGTVSSCLLGPPGSPLLIAHSLVEPSAFLCHSSKNRGMSSQWTRLGPVPISEPEIWPRT